MTARLFGIVLFLAACGVSAQSADWTRVAANLDQLNAQILDWSEEYRQTALPGDLEASAAVVTLHFRRGPVVASGLSSLMKNWLSASETQKKSRYLAVARYFATHTDDWGTLSAWTWYRCFAPPLDERYNALAAEAGLPLLPEAPAAALKSGWEEPILQRTLPWITTFLAFYGYPIVDTSLTRLGLDAQGVLVDGRTPRDRQLLNKAFSYAGTTIRLFGAGF